MSAQGQRGGAGREGAGSLQGLQGGWAQRPRSLWAGQSPPMPVLCPGNQGLPRPQGPGTARPPTRAARPQERAAQGAHPVTQPSTANVSGRGPRAGHGRAPSPEAGGRSPEPARAGGVRREGVSGPPPPEPARGLRAPGRTCARKARRRPRCARPLAQGRPGGARGRSPGSGASASRSSRAAAAAGAGSPWRGRAPAAFAPRPAPLRAPPAPPPAAPLGIARAGRGLGRPGPAPRWLRPPPAPPPLKGAALRCARRRDPRRFPELCPAAGGLLGRPHLARR